MNTQMTNGENEIATPFGLAITADMVISAPNWNRTSNLRIKSPPLCQLSYGRNLQLWILEF